MVVIDLNNQILIPIENLMKIGVITLPLHVNYGGILQAYALQTVLERMGHEVEVIGRPTHGKEPLWNKIKRFPIRLFYKLINKYCSVFHKRRSSSLRGSLIGPFVENKIHTRDIRNYEEIKPVDYDAFVVGSDQIWRLLYNKLFLYDSYLQFTKGWKVKRVAYAVSFGETEWKYSPKQTAICRGLIEKFDAVSVREDSAVDLCRDNLGVTPLHVLDPTLLLTREDYLNLMDNFNQKEGENYLLAYLLYPSEEKIEFVNRIAKDRSLKLKLITLEENGKSVLPSVEEWIKGFSEADFVITDSFHACVFSFIFNKPFVAFGYGILGVTRLRSLLQMFGMEYHLLSCEEDYDSSFDYRIEEKAIKTLEYKRKESFSFLEVLK
jgi:hypothetical protein